jgi:L-fuculose-phosphate aldolase
MNARVTLPELQREVVRVSHALHARGWVANHEGNVTALTAEGKVLATPTAMSKADVREADLLLLDRFGQKVQGARKPFGELPMHLAVYTTRPDVGAVVHAHPPASTAFAVAGRPIEALFLPEFIVSIGGTVPVVPFALPGSEALNGLLQPFLEPFDVVLLGSHGVLAWGPDLATALLRIEHCEEAANLVLNTGRLGGANPLPDEMVRLLLDSRTKAGLGPSGRARAKALPAK